MGKIFRTWYVKILDWWRPIYYVRILRRPTTNLKIHSLQHQVGMRVRKNG